MSTLTILRIAEALDMSLSELIQAAEELLNEAKHG
jgi:hypothetical protein